MRPITVRSPVHTTIPRAVPGDRQDRGVITFKWFTGEWSEYSGLVTYTR